MSDAPVQAERVACALCGADDTRPRHHKFDLAVVQCNRCRLVYANPRPVTESLFERYSSDYFWDEYLRGLGIARDGYVDPARFAAHHYPLLHLFEMYRPPPGRLLEVGAAAGLFMKSAQTAGWQVHGVEPLPAAAAFARHTFGLDVFQGTLAGAPWEPESFDAVAMFETIEHLQDPIGVLRRAHGLLRERGLLVISTPNWEAFTRHALGRQWAVISPAEHLYYFSEATLTAALKLAGFSWVHYHRDFAPGPLETMNADYTHAPGSVRHRLYRAFVRAMGPSVFRRIQARGLADQLICIARR